MPGPILGYCTNVHAGRTLDEARQNLQQHAVAVRERLGWDVLPVGLWLSGRAARDLLTSGEAQAFGRWLAENHLKPFSFNGFPFGDFHSPVVKHAVYEPDWADPARLAYTKDLITILAGWMTDADGEGSISTLPAGWMTLAADESRLDAAAANLIRIADHLEALEAETGRLIHLDLEPEPGCVLERAADVVEFFEGRLAPRAAGDRFRRYLRVCHDVCHAAVMFEKQAEAIHTYEQAGIRIGKVQISSAVAVDFDALDAPAREIAWHRLREFAEPRYLHQTVVRDVRAGSVILYDDLDEAIRQAEDDGGPHGQWRVHFHVPVFLDSLLGAIGATRDDIRHCIDALRGRGVNHWEVETYAWNVLPPAQRVENLAQGIAEEIQYVQRLLTTHGDGGAKP